MGWKEAVLRMLEEMDIGASQVAEFGFYYDMPWYKFYIVRENPYHCETRIVSKPDNKICMLLIWEITKELFPTARRYCCFTSRVYIVFPDHEEWYPPPRRRSLTRFLLNEAREPGKHKDPLSSNRWRNGGAPGEI